MKKKHIFLGLISFATVIIVLYITYINGKLNEVSGYVDKKIEMASAEAANTQSIMTQVTRTLDQKYNEVVREMNIPIGMEKLNSKTILEKIDGIVDFSDYIKKQRAFGEEQKRKLSEFTSQLEQDVNKKINSIKNFIIAKYCNKRLDRIIGNIRKLESGYNEILNSLNEKGQKYLDDGKIVLNSYLKSIEDESKPIFDRFFLANLRDNFSESNHLTLLNPIIKDLDAKIDLLSRMETKILRPETMTQNDFNYLKILIESTGNEKYKNYAHKILNSVVEIVSTRFKNRREEGYPVKASFECLITIKNHTSFPINMQIALVGCLEIKTFKKKATGPDGLSIGLLNEMAKFAGTGYKMDDMLVNTIEKIWNINTDYPSKHQIENIPANGEKSVNITLWSNYAYTYIGVSGKMKNFKLNVESWEPAIHNDWRE